MKKDCFKKFIAGAMIGGVLTGATGCDFSKSDTNTISVDVSGVSLFVYDEFDPTQIKLIVKDKNGNETKIDVTEDMIKEIPDLTTPGEKSIIIVYNDVEYECKFTVQGQTREEMLAKIDAFMEDYKKSSNVGDLNVDVTGSYVAKLLGESATGNSDVANLRLTQSDASFDNLAKYLYSTIMKSLVKNSADLDSQDIINSNEFTAKMDLLKILAGIDKGLADFNYFEYINHSLEENDIILDLVDELTYLFCDTFAFDFTRKTPYSQKVFVNESEVKSFINTTIKDYMAYLESMFDKNVAEEDKLTFDIVSVLSEMKDLINEYSTEGFTKDCIASILDNAITAITESGDAEKDKEERVHILSTVLHEMAQAFYDNEMSIISKYIEGDGVSWSRYEIVETEEAYDMTKTIYDKIANIIYALESIEEFGIKELNAWVEDEFVNEESSETEKTEEEIQEEKDAKKAELDGLFNELAIALKGFDSLIETFEDNEWDSPSTTEFKVFTYVGNIIAEIPNSANVFKFIASVVDIEPVEGDVKSILELLIEEMVYTPEEPILDEYINRYGEEDGQLKYNEAYLRWQDEIKNSDSWKKVLKQAILDMLNGKLNGESDLDADTYIENLAVILECTPEQIETYKTEWHSTGFCSILSDCLKNSLPDEEEYPDDYKLAVATTNLVEYLENCLRNKLPEEEKVVFALEQFRSHVDEIIKVQKKMITADLSIMFVKMMNINVHTGEYEEVTREVYNYELGEWVTYTYEEPVYEPYFDEEQYNKVLGQTKLVTDYMIGKYLDGTIESYKNNILADYFKIIDKYAHPNMKITFATTALQVMIGMELFGDQEFDYNKIFSFVKLPNGIESIDYNKMVDKITSVDTYKDMYKISDVQIKYETDSTGKIVKEIMELKLSVNYDVFVASMDAEFIVKLEFSF